MCKIKYFQNVIKPFEFQQQKPLRKRMNFKSKYHPFRYRFFYFISKYLFTFNKKKNSVNQLHPEVKRILRLFRLRQLHNGTFLRINKATLNMLKKVLPFITFGYANIFIFSSLKFFSDKLISNVYLIFFFRYPTRQTIQKLLLKRGFAKVNGQRIPLTDNTIIEKALGTKGINCLEDLVHELITVGPHFKEANNFLWPFKLDTPRGGFSNKRHAFHQGGDWGNREIFINDLIKAML